MKNHFKTLFSQGTGKKTVLLGSLAVLMIAAALIIGTTDNPPVILLLLAGTVVLFFAFLHPWKKASSFVSLMAVCFVLLTLDFVFPPVSEAFAMSAGFLCMAGVVTGIIGIFTRTAGWSRIPYTAARVAGGGLAVLLSMNPRPLDQVLSNEFRWLLFGGQLLAVILLLAAGIMNRKRAELSQAVMITSGIILILLCAWGIYTSILEFSENAKGFTNLMLRVYAAISVFAGVMALYGSKK